MKPFRYLTAVEQLARHLHGEILRGELAGEMPGVGKLVTTLGCSPRTIVDALKQLEHAGILQKQGAGRRSRITPREDLGPTNLRVSILLHNKSDVKAEYGVSLRHQLQEAGHSAGFTEKTLQDLGMDLKRVARFVTRTDADAWIVVGGSRDILEWFANHPVPAFAFFGRQSNVRIAGTGPHKSDAFLIMVRRLIELGHRRIVFLVNEDRRKPQPGNMERAFLGELEAQGVSIGSYNLPDWEDSPEGFHSRLTSLFHHTPPTALIPDTIELYTATLHFLARHGIKVPDDVSLVSTDPHPAFAWCHPPIACIDYDSGFWVRKAVQWVNKVALGKDDRQQSRNIAKFIDGATLARKTLIQLPEKL
jgi:DNA-binding LacI/PurR family transcriptional regulator/DNA-binding transcriptional regulator YhcF (GntR family)